ncbi:MAG: CAP domain-containing protein [Paracoccaceae bacterium]|nr:CAP domain-containing protein [Paracoccaceae bacterium]
MPLSATEQYGIELLNRARLDPLGEAARFGISLNENLAAGTITAAPKQVLAGHDTLNASADNHSQWMLDTGNFSHTGVDGTDPGQRMVRAGFQFFATWSWGENLAFASLGGTRNVSNITDVHHDTLMHSAGHRVNIMRDSFREIGYSQVSGQFNGGDGSLVTENFASRSTRIYVTGVVYADNDRDDFYSLGEGQSGIRFAMVGGGATSTASAGGYALSVAQKSAVTIDIGTNGSIGRVTLNLSQGNVKLDLVNGDTLLTSGHTTLVSGVADARLLGVGNYALTGNGAANVLEGNDGANIIRGGGGRDRIFGGAGNDKISGNGGNDRLDGGGGRDRMDGGAGRDLILGGSGNDTLQGRGGADVLNGGAGNDLLAGGAHGDRLTGGAGADIFIFTDRGGADVITDFSSAQGDRLRLDDALWSGKLTGAQVVAQFADVTANGVVFDFGDGDLLTLSNVSTLNGLATVIDII